MNDRVFLLCNAPKSFSELSRGFFRFRGRWRRLAPVRLGNHWSDMTVPSSDPMTIVIGQASVVEIQAIKTRRPVEQLLQSGARCLLFLGHGNQLGTPDIVGAILDILKI